MAQYTTLNLQEVETIFNSFDISTVNNFKILSGGSENTNYIVDTASGDYVLTICEQKSFERALELAQLLDHLQSNKFQSSQIIKTKENLGALLWNNKPIIIKRFIPGKIIENLSNHLIRMVGIELAKLHKISPLNHLPHQVSYGKEQFKKVDTYAKDSTFNTWLKEMYNHLQPYFSEELPKSIVHSDVFADNVIVSNDEQSLMIMDFEEAAYYYSVFDIGMTIIGTCQDGEAINLEKANCLLKGYQEELPLKQAEINALQPFAIYAATAMTYWRHVNFNLVMPDPKMANHYLGLKVLADHLRSLPEEYFLNQILK